MKRLASLVAAALLCACSSDPSRIPVRAVESDLVGMAGDWSGTFTSSDGARVGSMSFHLAAEEKTAYGDILLVADPPYRPANEREAGPERAAKLQVRFVRVEGGRVSGTIEPYRDPECGCVVSTTFEGALHGNVVEGTYQSNGGPSHPQRSGVWRVARARNP